jgi:hypothetical protein
MIYGINTPAHGKPRKGPGDYAKQNIFKEIVAFANSEGGWVVLGLTETSDHPKRVKGIDPIPDCHELAERLKRAAYDWIDPPIPSLQFRGIVMEKTGEGIVVIRVPRSLDAPHRLYKKDRTQEAFKRVNDESKPMKMREIQDLTLAIARGQERLDKEFEDSRQRYLKIRPQESPKDRLIGFNITNITLVPLVGPLNLDRPYLQTSLFERKKEIKGFFNIDKYYLPIGIIGGGFSKPSIVRPILRGGMKTWSVISSTHNEKNEVSEDIIILKIFVTVQPPL